MSFCVYSRIMYGAYTYKNGEFCITIGPLVLVLVLVLVLALVLILVFVLVLVRRRRRRRRLLLLIILRLRLRLRLRLLLRAVQFVDSGWTSDVGVWHLKETEVLRKEVSYCLRPGVRYPQLFFVLYLQRKPHYYIIHITVPCIFLTFIALLVRNNRHWPVTVLGLIYIYNYKALTRCRNRCKNQNSYFLKQ